MVALDVKTGKLRWHFQFTPHDVHDWDATEPLVLANVPFGGKERKLLMQANRNGFFYILDRTTGEFLLGKPFVTKLTWASGLDANGRPKLLSGNTRRYWGRGRVRMFAARRTGIRRRSVRQRISST